MTSSATRASYGSPMRWSPRFWMVWTKFRQGIGKASVDAINVFREEYGTVPIAVCSRTSDYE
jgi:hypothetical protein